MMLLFAVLSLVPAVCSAFEGSAALVFATREAYVEYLNAQSGQTWEAGVSAQPPRHDLGTDLSRRRAPGDVDGPVEVQHIAIRLLIVKGQAVRLFVEELRHVAWCPLANSPSRKTID